MGSLTGHVQLAALCLQMPEGVTVNEILSATPARQAGGRGATPARQAIRQAMQPR